MAFEQNSAPDYHDDLPAPQHFTPRDPKFTQEMAVVKALRETSEGNTTETSDSGEGGNILDVSGSALSQTNEQLETSLTRYRLLYALRTKSSAQLAEYARSAPDQVTAIQKRITKDTNQSDLPNIIADLKPEDKPIAYLIAEIFDYSEELKKTAENLRAITPLIKDELASLDEDIRIMASEVSTIAVELPPADRLKTTPPENLNHKKLDALLWEKKGLKNQADQLIVAIREDPQNEGAKQELQNLAAKIEAVDKKIETFATLIRLQTKRANLSHDLETSRQITSHALQNIGDEDVDDAFARLLAA